MIERRNYAANVGADKNKLMGLASPTYNGTPGTEFALWEDTVERFAPGAFDNHLATNPDVVALFNHDPNQVLGRTPDTLRLRADASGLFYEVDLPDTRYAKDLKTSIKRGDIRGSSFAFIPKDVEWQRDGNKDVRLIRQATVHDVSVVTQPAYDGTNVGLRSNDERRSLEKERDEYLGKLHTEKWLKKIEAL